MGAAAADATVRIRGTIEAVDGPMLSIKSREGNRREGEDDRQRRVFAVVKTSLSESRKAPISASPRCPSLTAPSVPSPCTSFQENQRGAG
jgi:hypothetical protein